MAIRVWAIRWIDRLATLQRRPKTLQTPHDIDAIAGRVEAFVGRQFTGGKCSLTTAQFVIARTLGFASWPKFARHLTSLQDRTSAVAAFEAAASAVVSGETETLRRLLRPRPRLVHTRSTREHGEKMAHWCA